MAGIYNTVTPVGSYTMGDLHDDSLAVSASDMNAVWVDSAFVDEHELAEGRSIPIWSSPEGEYSKVAMVNGEKAVAAGLNNRPVRETARDALAWWKTLPEERTLAPRAGLDPAKEAEALALWKAQQS